MFIAAKLLSFATQPLAWAMLLLAFGLLATRRWPALGNRLCWAALVVLALTGWQVPVDAVLGRLEAQSPPPDASASLAGYAGVVVEIVKGSLKIQSRAGTTCSYNGIPSSALSSFKVK